MWGDGPMLLIVDNLTDVLRDNGDEWGKEFLKDLKFLARSWNLCALVLHHMCCPAAPRGNGSIHGSDPG